MTILAITILAQEVKDYIINIGAHLYLWNWLKVKVEKAAHSHFPLLIQSSDSIDIETSPYKSEFFMRRLLLRCAWANTSEIMAPLCVLCSIIMEGTIRLFHSGEDTTCFLLGVRLLKVNGSLYRVNDEPQVFHKSNMYIFLYAALIITTLTKFQYECAPLAVVSEELRDSSIIIVILIVLKCLTAIVSQRTLLWLGHETETINKNDSNSVGTLVTGSLKGYKGIMLSLGILVLSMTMQQVFRVRHNGLW